MKNAQHDKINFHPTQLVSTMGTPKTPTSNTSPITQFRQHNQSKESSSNFTPKITKREIFNKIQETSSFYNAHYAIDANTEQAP